MEHGWNEIDRVKPKYSGKTFSPCHLVHHKYHMDWPGIETGPPRWGGRLLTAWAMARPQKQYAVPPINRPLVIRTANYPDRLGPSANFVENSTKLICREITGYRIEYSTVKCYGCRELQIMRGRKV
jgi:hypothetical protein